MIQRVRPRKSIASIIPTFVLWYRYHIDIYWYLGI